jgi:hypothetical protein
MPHNKRTFAILSGIAILCAIFCDLLIVTYVSGKNADWRVILWWIVLSAISVGNIFAWIFSYGIFRQKAHADPRFSTLRKWYPLLTGIYVAVCAFRSFLPRVDVQAYVLVNSWLSSIFVGRSVATLAELCFMGLLCIYLREVAKATGCRTGVIVSWIVVPLIAIAECFSWYSVITTSYLGNSVEESTWAFCEFLLLISLILIWPKAEHGKRRFLAPLLLVVGIYVVYMVTLDVPLYVSNYLADQAAAKVYLNFFQGIASALHKWIVTYSYADWSSQMLGVLLYFSITVWVSIALLYAPRFAPTPNIS